MRLRRFATVVVTAFACGCGAPSYVALTVDAALEVPSEADSIEIVTADASDRSELALNDIELGSGDTFPFDVLLEIEDGVAGHLLQQITARLGDTVVARGAAEHDWKPGLITRVALPPLTRVP